MKFRTPIKLNLPKFQLDIRDKVMLMGSCFSENIAERMKLVNWNISANSHGILFNPASIYKAIEELSCCKEYTLNDVFEANELWYSWQHHGSFAQTNAVDSLNTINESIRKGNQFLTESNCVIITFGSAWVYKHIVENKVVANCHKLPQGLFKKELLSVFQITERVTNSIDLLKAKNPNLKVILTLSPVRYLKDGFVENARSKAHLLSAIHEVADTYKEVDYFPAYETFIDDLRDYRFNASDLLHPNEQAIDYIWEEFINQYCNKETKDSIEELQAWRRMMNHRPLHSGTQQHDLFKKDLLIKTQELKKKYTFLDFSKDLGTLERKE